MKSSPTPPLPSGDIEFFDNAIPVLEDGDYKITATPALSGDNRIQSSDLSEKTQLFSVQGARFKLNSTSDIHAIYPPDKSQGQFEEKLPSIILTKRTLPWERTLVKQDSSSDRTPWIALLLFDENEILSVNTEQKLGPTKASTIPLREIRNYRENGVLGPAIPHLDYGQSDDTMCQTIEISTDTFINTAPYLEELRFLAHCRQVNVENKTVMNMRHSGWFSVVVCNRFPIKNPSEPTKQICHLVSLEGFSDYLKPQPVFPQGTKVLRLISLASWSFTCLPKKGESFSELMLNLVKDKATEDLLFKLPSEKTSAQSTEEQKLVNDAFSCGFVPLSYQTRPGDQTFAWYRGPLSPVSCDRFTEKLPPFESSSEAIIYDQNTGIFNLSYAIAWQTGRSLALADRTFATNLMKWRRQMNRFVDLCFARFKDDHLEDLIDIDKNPKNIEAINIWLEQQLVSNQFLNYLLTDFSNKIAPRIPSSYSPIKPKSEEKSERIPDPAVDPSPLPSSLVDEFRKFLNQDNVKGILQNSGTEELAAIVEWLARLYLLYDLPANTFIPNGNLLPQESIRFFYLDRAWLDSLIDGALSVGAHTSKDTLYYQFTKKIIFDGIETLILEVREKLLGLPISSKKDIIKGDVTGFLLRSQVVQNWPGLEVKAYKTVKAKPGAPPEPSGPIQLLRMERLTPNLLLCLFPEPPSWVEFNEPKEGLCFGVEMKDQKEVIGLRDMNSGKLTGDNYSVKPLDYRKNSNSRVFNITRLQNNMAKTLGPAGFALQMVDVPEQMVFQNLKL